VVEGLRWSHIRYILSAAHLPHALYFLHSDPLDFSIWPTHPTNGIDSTLACSGQLLAQLLPHYRTFGSARYLAKGSL
jgi:hypothetical protein